MNHCITCGSKVTRGRTDAHASNHKQASSCLNCIQARVMRGWRYVSPAMKRWRKKKGHAPQARLGAGQPGGREFEKGRSK